MESLSDPNAGFQSVRELTLKYCRWFLKHEMDLVHISDLYGSLRAIQNISCPLAKVFPALIYFICIYFLLKANFHILTNRIAWFALFSLQVRILRAWILIVPVMWSVDRTIMLQ